MNLKKLIHSTMLLSSVVVVNFALLSSTTMAESSNARWYSTEQVKAGKTLFSENCQSCHGNQAQGIVKNWQEPNTDGKLPPPPLDGSAHAWHHPLNALRYTIREGGAKVGGVMPPFKDKLNNQQVNSVIAWFQSLWTDDIYQAWVGRTGFTKVNNTSAIDAPIITRYLTKQINPEDIGEIKPSPIKGLMQTKIGNDLVFLSEDGRYLIMGEMLDLRTQENLSKRARQDDSKKILDTIKEEDLIIYPVNDKNEAAKQVLTIFTDTSCPYCKKLHEEIDIYQKAGITIRYAAFPRSGLSGVVYKTMQAVWCADNPQQAMSIAKGLVKGKTEADLDMTTCERAKGVDNGFEAGKKLGITGTPAIFLPDGELINGYVPAEQLIKNLKEGFEVQRNENVR